MEVPPPQTQPTETEQTKKPLLNILTKSLTVWNVLLGIIPLVLWFVYHYGAAKLSYNTYGSTGWSILAFIFAPVYYPYYGLFVSTPVSTGIFGAARKLKR